MITALGETKTCHRCLQVQPLDEFRRRYRNRPERMNDCVSCHNDYERVRQRNARLKGRDKTIGHFAVQLKNTTDQNRVLLLCHEMFARYGGVEGFAKAWAQQSRRAMQSRPGSTPALNFFIGVANLAKHIKDIRPAVKELDDANLEDELTVAVTRLIQSRPEMAAEALQRGGEATWPAAGSQTGHSPGLSDAAARSVASPYTC